MTETHLSLIDLPKDCLVEISKWGNYATCFLLRLTCRHLRSSVPPRESVNRNHEDFQCIKAAIENGEPTVIEFLLTIERYADCLRLFPFTFAHHIPVDNLAMMRWYFPTLIANSASVNDDLAKTVVEYVEKVLKYSTSKECVVYALETIYTLLSPDQQQYYRGQIHASLYEYHNDKYEELNILGTIRYKRDDIHTISSARAVRFIRRHKAKKLYELLKDELVDESGNFIHFNDFPDVIDSPQYTEALTFSYYYHLELTNLKA